MAGPVLTVKQLKNTSVADLRTMLRNHGLKVSGVKQELVDRLAKHYKSASFKASNTADAASFQAPVAEARQEVEIPVTEQCTEHALTTASDEPAPATEVGQMHGAHSTEGMPALDLQGEIAPASLSSPMEVEVETLPARDRPEALPAMITPTDANAEIETSVAPISAAVEDKKEVGEAAAEALSVPMQLDMNTHTEPTLCRPNLTNESQKEPPSVDPSPPNTPAVPLPTSAHSNQLPAAKVSEAAPVTMAEQVKPEKELLMSPPPKQAFAVSTMPDEAVANAVDGGRTVVPSRPPRKIATRRVTLSPTALLAPEVTAPDGTPSKEDATPLKDERNSWRELCAREAAGLRTDRSSRSPCSRSRSPLLRKNPTPGSRIVLRRRQSVLQNGRTPESTRKRRVSFGRGPMMSPKSEQRLSGSASKVRCSPGPGTYLHALNGIRTPTNRKTPSKRCSPRSRSRSPASHAQQQRARNCLFATGAVTPRSETPRAVARTPRSPKVEAATPCRTAPNVATKTLLSHGYGYGHGAEAENPLATATPQETRARLRAAELREELLKRSAQRKPVTAEDLCPPPGNWSSDAVPPRNLALAMQDAATSACSSKDQLLGGKQRMLEQLTRQMQTCLARVQDPKLDDANREKYQNLASSIHTQLENIGSIRCPAGSPMARGGC